MSKLGLAGLLLIVGCGPSISTVKTGPSPRPLMARSPAQLEIYTTKIPTRPYAEVAVFTASKGKAADHIDALREHAASYGCDALVFTVMPRQQDFSSSSGKPGELSTTTTTSSVASSSATCVVWNDAATLPTAMPASSSMP